MDTSKIGYIICESSYTPVSSDVKIVDEAAIDNPSGGTKKRLIAECVLQRADEVNRNGRIYPKEELIPAIHADRVNELLRAKDLRSEVGHPISKELSRQQLIDKKLCCSRFLKLWNEGPVIMGLAKGTYNSYGDEFDMDLREGCLPAWSLRALGTVNNTGKGAEVHNLTVITYDNVIYPSHPGAYTRRVVNGEEKLSESYTRMVPESVLTEGYDMDTAYDKGLFVPITTSSMVDYIKHESGNIKTVLNTMDTLFESIIPIDNCSKVQLTTTDGDIMIINLESYVHNEIMSYCESRL